MKSGKAKVLHRLLGRPLVEHVLNAALYLKPEKLVLVTGFQAEEVEADVSAFLQDLREKRGPEAVPEPLFARQTEQLGTGHAVAMARDHLRGFRGPLFIAYGDMPLVSPNTLDGFLKAHQALRADLSALTVRLDDPAAYGRIIRDEQGWLKRIVEYRDADEAERLVREINSGLYWVDAARLYEAVERLRPDNDQDEYYLTDVVADFRARGLSAAAVEIPESLAHEVRGINDRYELAEAQAILRDRLNAAWMRAGVTLMDPLSTLIEASVRLSPDVTLWPGVILTGRCQIGPGAEIGPFCHLNNCTVAAGAKIKGQQILSDQALGAD
jgi:bifunctional UDP-N-acetylglucosamine pyrophosphorylase/glucosamine-1-phosphate N-acetyltransferase